MLPTGIPKSPGSNLAINRPRELLPDCQIVDVNQSKFSLAKSHSQSIFLVERSIQIIIKNNANPGNVKKMGLARQGQGDEILTSSALASCLML